MDKTANTNVNVLDHQTLKVICVLNGHTDTVNSAQYSPDGIRIITGSNDKTVKIWDASTYQLLASLDHKKKVLKASYSKDCKYIVSLLEDGSVNVWDAYTFGKLKSTIGLNQCNEYSNESPDGKFILVV